MLPIYGGWKEFYRRCGCLEADSKHFERLLHKLNLFIYLLNFD
jgi:hypothetical protein